MGLHQPPGSGSEVTDHPERGGGPAGDGTVETKTFVFTDVEGSSRLWESDPEEMKAALQVHDRLIRDTLVSSGGQVVKATGDGALASFDDARSAVLAAIRIQEAVAESLPFRVRIALHSGEAEHRDGDYFGPTLNRAARLLSIGHGGQVLLSQASEQLARDHLSEGVELLDLGEHHLRDLARPERVFQLAVPGLQRDFPRLLSVVRAPTNLPVQLTSFVGREGEISAIGELLEHHRMVTLTGPGGVGKTRLALQVAAESVVRFSGGVWLADLSSVDAARVVEVVASAVGVVPQTARPLEECLVDEVRQKQLLVVLDNCEHIVGEVRRLSEVLLREASSVSLMATSREGLRVQGEQLFSVPSLDGDAASSLFVERAQAVDPAFDPTDGGRAAIAEVCTRLDGIPLAIELAAARVGMFSTEELAVRVKQRFRLLTGGRGTVERHQTLRAAVDWSYDLLDSSERRAFDRMSVFAGGCTLEAAEAIVGDSSLEPGSVLDLLSELVSKSLVVVDRAASSTRYGMLETIRQYAEERLVHSGDAEEVRARHARWYADFARSAGRGLYSPDELRWLERLKAEMDNLQVAVVWAVGAGETDVAMRLGGSFPRQAMARPLLGTAALAERCLGVTGADTHPSRSRAMAEAAWAKLTRGDYDGARRLLADAIESQRNGARYAAAAYNYMLIPIVRYDIHQSLGVAKAGLEAAESAGDALGAIGCRAAYSIHCMLVGREEEALREADRALAEVRAVRQPSLEAAALYAKGLSLFNSDPEQARSMLEQSVAVCDKYNIESERALAFGVLAAIEAEHGDARRALEATLEALKDRSFRFLMATDLYFGAAAFVAVGRPDLTALVNGKCDSAAGSGPSGFSLYGAVHLKAASEAKAILGNAEFDRHAAAGASMTWDEFVDHMAREVEATLAAMPPPTPSR